jgi:hypothetical protein
MDSKTAQLNDPLNYQFNDPEAANQTPSHPENDPPKPFNEPKPEVGYEFVPP